MTNDDRATRAKGRADRDARRRAINAAVRRYPEPDPSEVYSFGASWKAITGQNATPNMHRFLALILRVYGPEAERVLRERFAKSGTTLNLIIDMLEPEPNPDPPAAPDQESAGRPWAPEEVADIDASAPSPTEWQVPAHDDLASITLSLDPEIVWRVKVMRTQLPQPGEPFRPLRARPGPHPEGTCDSCGEDPDADGSRCYKCRRAVAIAVDPGP